MKVVKFGGTSIQTPERMKLAGKSIKKLVEKGEKIFVVVSAMGNETDRLIGMLNDAGIHQDAWFLAVGEIKSARFLTLVLRDMGVEVEEVEPQDPLWPVVVENGEPVIDEGRKRMERLLEQKKRAEVFVIPGFICTGMDGTMNTLGRGGSDTTAFIIGRLVDADEVIIVTDVEGVYNADPNIFPTERIKGIHADKLSDLSAFGAGVIHPDALKHKGEKQRSKIIHFKFGDLEYEGTYIFGEVERKIFLLKEILALVTIHRRGILENNNDLLRVIPDIRIYGITTGIDYTGFYVKDNDADAFANRMLEHFKGIELTIRREICMVVFKKESPRDRPGLVSSILDKLKKHGINLVEISSIGREIQVYVEERDGEKVIEILRREEKDA